MKDDPLGETDGFGWAQEQAQRQMKQETCIYTSDPKQLPEMLPIHDTERRAEQSPSQESGRITLGLSGKEPRAAFSSMAP